MCSEIKNQLAGLLFDVLFLPQYKLPNVQLRPLTISPWRTGVFRIICRQKPCLGEFTISLVLVVSCEPVKVESESRNFSVTDGNKNNHP